MNAPTTQVPAIASEALRIERIDLHLLRVPLHQPYRLAFGDLHAFDTLLVELTDSEGRTGFGEATILTGYTEENFKDACALAQRLAEMLKGAGRRQFEAEAARIAASAPFTATAFMTALEMLEGSAALVFDRPVRVPLLALLQGEGREAIAREFDAILEGGYRTVKVKVGLAGGDDLARVRDIQSVVAGRARIRIDANQAFNAAEAVRFLKALDPQDIELFEQPCAAGDWQAQAAAVQAARVPLMLDESIYGLPDIERTGREGLAAFVKVKLMKFGSLAKLAESIERIKALGMQPVLGNGVACDAGCWMEACVAARHIDNAGEMNGFLKTRAPLFARPLRVERGEMVIGAGDPPLLDRDALKRFAIARESLEETR